MASLWVLHHNKERGYTSSIRSSVRRLCVARGWPQPREVSVSDFSIPTGRQYVLLPREQAAAMYRAAHRERVAVLDTAATIVCIRREPKTANERYFRRLSEFLQYKAFYWRLEAADQDSLNMAVRRFDEWHVDGCDGKNDPRVLPLHVFSAGERDRLDEADYRRAFNERYGHANRTDEEKLSWTSDPSLHGQPALQLRGVELQRGFHWDVAYGDSSFRISTPEGTWKVDRYVNIYPDAHIRGDHTVRRLE